MNSPRVNPPKDDLGINLNYKLDDITTASIDLRIVSDNFIELTRTENQPEWDNGASLGKYATVCYRRYSRQNPTNDKLYKDFLTCILAINYN